MTISKKTSAMVGATFGRLTVLSAIREGATTFVLCSCLCGGSAKTRPWAVRNGTTTSCGCAQREVIGAIARRHGGSGTPEHRAWKGLNQRCYREGSKAYRHYGARGIKVCDAWRRSFSTFLADMGLRPSAAHSVDRIDNNGNYEPQNCRWATRAQQSRNMRRTRRFRIGNGEMCLTDVAHGIQRSRRAVYDRLAAGATSEDLSAEIERRAS